MNLIIAGGRDFDDYQLLVDSVNDYIDKRISFFPLTIICGMATGADLLGKRYAESHGLDVIEFPAMWRNKKGNFDRSAGFKRNIAMSKISSDCIVFYDGESKGSGHMIDIAKKQGIDLKVIKYDK